ncbi:hypothetical protein WDU94_005346 [Cyamophila willieti]
MTSPNNRIFFVQFMVDSVDLYNSYKYDTDYGILKVFVSKFLSYPTIDISKTAFRPNIEEGTADVKVNEGKTFMFSMFANEIVDTLKSFFIDFQVLLESDKEAKIKAGIENVVVGYTRIKMENELSDLIKAVDTVKSERPEMKEIEGAYVIRQNAEQVGTLFLGIRFTLFGNSIITSLRPETDDNINQSHHEEKKNQESVLLKPQQQPSKVPPNNVKQIETEPSTNQTKVKFEKPDDTGKDFKRAYTYIYTEMNGQIIDLKILSQPIICNPIEMKGSMCL